MLQKKYKSIIIAVISTAVIILGAEYIFFGGNMRHLLKINHVMNLLNDKFYFDIDENKIVDYALTGMTIASDDPYTNYYGASQFKGYLSNGENSYIGIGIIIGASEDNKNLQVISAMEGSPGERAGILSGDIILEINGEQVTSDDLNSVADKLKGKSNDIGTPVSLKIQRNANEILDIEVQKDSIEKDTVKSKIISDSIGYIRISAFDRRDSSDKNSVDTYDEFKKEAEELKNKGINKLILDLRDNPGGDVHVVSQIADYILPEGVITYTEDKKGKREYVYSDKSFLDMKIVVLVNGGSASSSEILTGALKDCKKAEIVGTKTYGKGIVQTIFSLNDGSGISVTTSKYYSPNGVCIHGIGIEPDYIVELPEGTFKPTSLLTEDEDTQLQKAIELLNK